MNSYAVNSFFEHFFKRAQFFRGVTLQCLGHISSGRVVCCTVLVGCASSLDIPLPLGTVPQALPLFIVWRLRLPFQGNANGTQGIFWTTKGIWATALRPDSPKNGLLPHSYAGGADVKYSALVSFFEPFFKRADFFLAYCYFFFFWLTSLTQGPLIRLH